MLSDIKHKTEILKAAAAAVCGGTFDLIQMNLRGLFGYVRWAALPRRYSIAHMEYQVRTVHPYGSQWIWSPYETLEGTSTRRVCSTCSTGHPLDFLNFVSKYNTRYDPHSAHEDMLELIERGDMEKTPENMQRWQRIPDDAVLLYSVVAEVVDGVNHALLVAVASDGMHWATSLDHVLDLVGDDVDTFLECLSEWMPEWSVETSHPYGLSTLYDPDTDIMYGVNPGPIVHVASIRNHILTKHGGEAEGGVGLILLDDGTGLDEEFGFDDEG